MMMLKRVPQSSRGPVITPMSSRRSGKIPCFIGILPAAAVVLAAAITSPLSMAVRGGIDDPPRSNNSGETADRTSRSDFLAEIHTALKTQHERMIELVNRKLAAGGDRGSLQDALLNQQITTESANSIYRNAKLAREVAEFAVIEYTQGIYRQDEAVLQGELKLAQSDLNRKQSGIDGIKELLARAEKASNGSASDLSIVFGYADRVAYFERAALTARNDVEKVESKLRMLVKFTKPIQVLELKAEVAKARADELAKKAIFETETAKEKRLVAAVEADRIAPPPELRRRLGLRTNVRPETRRDEDRALGFLDKAVFVEEQIRAKLSQAAADGKLETALENETRDLMRQLVAIVDEAAAARADFQIDQLKDRIHDAAARLGAAAK